MWRGGGQPQRWRMMLGWCQVAVAGMMLGGTLVVVVFVLVI